MWTTALLAALMSPTAHALDASDWQDTRWLLEAEAVYPRALTLLAVENTGIRTKASQLRAVVDCDKVEPVGKKALIVLCSFEEVSLKATPNSDVPKQKEIDDGTHTIEDILARYRKATLEFQINKKGKVTRVDVRDLPTENARERDGAEVMRQLATDLVTGFNVAAPAESWESAWGESNSNLMRIAGVRQAGTSNQINHQGQMVEDKLVVQSVGRGMISIPYDAWELESGEKLPFLLAQDSSQDGGGGTNADGQNVGGTRIGGGFQQQGASAAQGTPDLKTYSAQMSGVAIVRDNRIVERIWTVAGEDSGGVGQMIDAFYNGHFRLLNGDEKVDLGTSGLVAPPNQEVEGLPTWVPLNE